MTKPRGRHPHNKLSAVRVRNIKEAGRYADGNGLYLVVDPSGARRWILRTVIRGHRRDLGLGSTQLVELADARVEAARLRRLARTGADPFVERRRERRKTLTFKEAAKRVHESHAGTFKNVKHRAQWLSSLEADVFPVFGDRPVDSIEASDVLKALSPIWTTKPETARRLKQRIKVVLDWAKASGYRTGDNAVDGVAKVLPKVRQTAAHHPALPYKDIPAFVLVLRDFNASASIKLAFEFLILTAARTSEVLEARWAEIDREKDTWTVPASRIKAGREHRVPLSARSLEILDDAKAMADGGPFVFPGRSPNAPLSNMAFLMLLRRMARKDITAHGFRSSFRDWAAEMKASTPRTVVESALAHVVKDKTEAAYFRSDLFELRRELMDAWERFAMTQPKGKEAAKVLRMRRRSGDEL
jgi:integrase